MTKKDKTATGVLGVIMAVGGFIAAIAYASNQQTFYLVLSALIALVGVWLIAKAVSN